MIGISGIIVLILVSLRNCNCQEDISPNKTNVNTFVKLEIPAKYLKGARWEIGIQNPIRIYHSIEISDVSKISVENGDFRLDLNLRQRWTEDNLMFPTGLFLDNETDDTAVTADSDVLNALWVPDLYFPNARSSAIESLVSKHANVLLFKNKTIMYFATLTTTLGCPMEFQWYPLDIQRCPLQVESYTYTDNKVIYEWENESAVILPDTFKLRRYALLRPLNWEQGTFTRFGRNDSYSRITITFVFERELGHHLIQVFIPTFLIVSLSWFSFWLGLDAIPGRVGLLVTCMLTLVTMYTGLKADLPPVTYIKILDIWMAACLLFVFAAMSEFIVVRTINHSQKTKNENQDKMMAEVEANDAEMKNSIPSIVISDNTEKSKMDFIANPYSEFYSHGRTTIPISRQLKNNARTAWDIPFYEIDKPRSYQSDSERKHHFKNHVIPTHYKSHPHQQKYHTRKKKGKRSSLWEKIDIASRIAFPLLFLSFCLVYWPVLIFGSQIQKH